MTRIFKFVLILLFFQLHMFDTLPNPTDGELFDRVEDEQEEDYLETFKILEEYSIASERRLPVFANQRRESDVSSTPSVDTSFPVVHNYTTEFLASANDYNITNRVLDIFFNTNYCGPGSVSRRYGIAGKSDRNGRFDPEDPSELRRVTYADLDMCCKMHDECPNYIIRPEDYAQYPGLEKRNQYFTRLECTCDGLFYKCLNNLNSRYASVVAIGYGIIQSYCFQFEHPIVKCNKRGFRRCVEYIVDESKPKQWQWFNLPPAYKEIFVFPQTMNGQ